MRNWLIVAVLFAIALAILLPVFLRLNQRPRGVMRNTLKTEQAPPAEVYLGLRNQVFQRSRNQIGIPPTAAPTMPWGVVMDWGLSENTATVLALSDGSASVYFSNGGGFIGGQSHETVQKAAKRAVEISAEVQPLMRATTEYPLPKRGEVIFYVLTDAGVFSATAPEQDLRTHRNPFSKLGDAAQEVISAYRLIQEKQPTN
jgi:hypothetical protein